VEESIPQRAIDSVARHINERNNKQYGIPVVGTRDNCETPQVFEILPFDQIDDFISRVYAVDGSKNSHSFYNGVSIGLYRAGYVCFQAGKPIRVNRIGDPIILGQSYMPENILITCDDHLYGIYEELLCMPTVARLVEFAGTSKEALFPYSRDAVCSSVSTLLSFCQEVLEWALVYEIACRSEIRPGDLILKDGPLRSLNIKQEFLVKLGKFLCLERQVVLVAITKNSPVKMELGYTLRQIDSYLQDKLRPQYPFKQGDPRRQKLCCWFEVPEAVLLNAYGSASSGMYTRKALRGGRGFGLFFAARLDYVEKLQNYDWVIADFNIFDAVPGIEQDVLTRDYDKLAHIFLELTRFTQEHYILGYPYPLVEAHNFVTLRSDFKEEVISRVKHSMYSTQQMDHIDIENLFLDIHSRF
jgi:hypothetical protein